MDWREKWEFDQGGTAEGVTAEMLGMLCLMTWLALYIYNIYMRERYIYMHSYFSMQTDTGMLPLYPFKQLCLLYEYFS